MRVLMVITTLQPEVGGPSTSAVNCAVAQQMGGAAVTVASTFGDRSPALDWPELALAGVRHREFRRPAAFGERGLRWGLSAPFALWILRYARRFDVIHVHYVWSLGTIVSVLAGALWRRPVVMTPHESLTTFGLDNSRSGLRRRQKLILRRLLLAGVDRVVTSSSLEFRDSDLSPDQACVIPYPVPLEDVATTDPGGPSAERRVGYLGRLHPKKRVGDLIAAFARLAPGATLLVGGDQPPDAFAELRARVVREGLGDRVKMLGFVAPGDRPAFFASIDVLAMPSSYECFGMVAAEALCAGVPVVVSERTGMADLVRRRDVGVVVPVGDTDALRAALELIISNPERLSQLRLQAREAASDELSLTSYASAIAKVYADVTDGVRRQGPKRPMGPIGGARSKADTPA